jgi:chorismate mutase
VTDDPRAALRARIDEADAALLHALAERYAAVRALAEVKRTKALHPVDEAREAALVAGWRAHAAALGVPEDAALAVMAEVLRGCRAEMVARCTE